MTAMPWILRLAQLQIVTVFLLPGDLVVKPLGGAATPATLLGLILAGWWMAAAIAGGRAKEPAGGMRLVVATVWCATLASTLAMVRRGDGLLDASDRWLMTLGAVTGITLVVLDTARRLEDIHRLLATAVVATAVSGVVGLLQRLTDHDLTDWLRRVPGLSTTTDATVVRIPRGSVERVVGTAIHPIEFGVVAALLLPVAVHLLWHDRRPHPWGSILGLVGLGLGIVLSVSRSAVVVAAVVIAVMILTSPAIERLNIIAVAPFALGGILVVNPGTFSALAESFARVGEDPSITARVDDLAVASDLVARHLWWGQGSGTYIASDVFTIFDNQYLHGAVEHGLIGVTLFAGATLLVPILSAHRLRRRVENPSARGLAGAVMAMSAGSIVAWATFDAWSFARFSAVTALTLATLGATWRLSHQSRRQEDEHHGSLRFLAGAVETPVVDAALGDAGDQRRDLRGGGSRAHL